MKHFNLKTAVHFSPRRHREHKANALEGLKAGRSVHPQGEWPRPPVRGIFTLCSPCLGGSTAEFRFKVSLPALLVLALGLDSGCVGTGPNTQQGAVGGAALGAIAGAIVGNNSGSHNALGGAAIGAAAGAVAGGAIGNSLDHQRGTIYYSEADATTNVVVQQPPPPPAPPAEVVVARPAVESVWVGGYWAYTGDDRRYVWVQGHWERPPPHYRAYVSPHWARRRGNYVYIQGYWH